MTTATFAEVDRQAYGSGRPPADAEFGSRSGSDAVGENQANGQMAEPPATTPQGRSCASCSQASGAPPLAPGGDRRLSLERTAPPPPQENQLQQRVGRWNLELACPRTPDRRSPPSQYALADLEWWLAEFGERTGGSLYAVTSADICRLTTTLGKLLQAAA